MHFIFSSTSFERSSCSRCDGLNCASFNAMVDVAITQPLEMFWFHRRADVILLIVCECFVIGSSQSSTCSYSMSIERIVRSAVKLSFVWENKIQSGWCDNKPLVNNISNHFTASLADECFSPTHFTNCVHCKQFNILCIFFSKNFVAPISPPKKQTDSKE